MVTSELTSTTARLQGERACGLSSRLEVISTIIRHDGHCNEDNVRDFGAGMGLAHGAKVRIRATYGVGDEVVTHRVPTRRRSRG